MENNALHPPQEPAAPTEPRRFGPSDRALGQRRALLLGVKVVTLVSLAVILSMFQPPLWWVGPLKWSLGLLLGWGIWRLHGAALLDPIRQRQLVLHPHALELSRGDFKRIVVFENLYHIHATQGADERMVSIVLHTADDSIVLRDLESLGEIFTALSAAKPASVLIEVETKRIDWGEPLPWTVAFGVLALFFALLAWTAPWQQLAYVQNNGRLLFLDGGLLVLGRPASRGVHWWQQAPEVTLGLLFVGLGRLFM